MPLPRYLETPRFEKQTEALRHFLFVSNASVEIFLFVFFCFWSAFVIRNVFTEEEVLVLHIFVVCASCAPPATKYVGLRDFIVYIFEIGVFLRGLLFVEEIGQIPCLFFCGG